MRKILGISIIALVFLMLFSATAFVHGIGIALISWGIAIVLVAMIIFAAKLIND